MLKIGDFSKLAQVTVKALRHYDQLGLLKPIWIDRFTGYRYYALDQLPQLNRILAMKDLGFSLDQIRILLREDIDAAELRGMLRMRKVELEQQIQNEQSRLLRLESRLKYLNQDGGFPRLEIVLKQIPEQRVIGVRRVASVENIPLLIRQLHQEAEARRFLAEPVLAPLVIYYDQEFLEQSLDIEIAFPCDRTLSDRFLVGKPNWNLHHLPGIETMACTVHQGTLADLAATHRLALVWIEENGFSVCGPAREVYFQTRDEKATGENLIVEVQFPVQKKPLPGFIQNHKEINIMEPRIETRPGFTAVGLVYYGLNQQNEIAALWQAFNSRIPEIRQVVDGAFGLCKPADESGAFHYLASLAVSDTSQVPAGMECWEVAEQQYAAFACTLPEVHKTYRYAFETWLPGSDYEYTGGIDFEYYGREFDPEHPDSPESRMYVFIPVQRRKKT